jgi:hypothetical protein
MCLVVCAPETRTISFTLIFEGFVWGVQTLGEINIKIVRGLFVNYVTFKLLYIIQLRKSSTQKLPEKFLRDVICVKASSISEFFKNLIFGSNF